MQDCTVCVIVIIIYVVDLGGAQIDDPCTSAFNIFHSSRFPNVTTTRYSAYLSDNNLSPDVWYTFGVYNRIPESCIPSYHCSTFAPIWVNGSQPTASSPGPVILPTCAQYYTASCCGYQGQVVAKWCQDSQGRQFYAYRLGVPVNLFSYCVENFEGSTNAGTKSTNTPTVSFPGESFTLSQTANFTTASNTKTPSSTPMQKTATCLDMKAPSLGYPYISEWKMVKRPRDIINATFNATKFSVDCFIGYPQKQYDGLTFTVFFEADGVLINSFRTNSTQTVVTMSESSLQGHLGRMITCLVTCADNSNEVYRPLQSNTSFVGLQPIDQNGNVLNRTVLRRGESFTFWMRSTIPITFGHCLESKEPCQPSYTFGLTTNKLKSDAASNCGFVISPSNTISEPIRISPIDVSVGLRKIIGLISFEKFTDGANVLYQGYKISNIEVELTDDAPRPLCISLGDPHLKPMGTEEYLDDYAVGDFYMLKSPKNMLEIQVRMIPCSDDLINIVSCNCGVIVREGNNILGITGCDYHDAPILVRYLQDPVFPSGTITWNDKNSTWIINTLSGISISVDAWDSPKGGKCLNIQVLGSNDDVYQGLCSNTTTPTTNLSQFIVDPHDSFFKFSSINPPKCINVTGTTQYCSCQGERNITGTLSQEIKCDDLATDNEQNPNLPLFITNPATTCSGPTKSKRSVPSDQTGFDVIRLDDLFSKIDPTLESKVIKNGNLVRPTSSGITKENATAKCVEVLKNSPAYSICIQQITALSLNELIRCCVADVELLNDLNSVGFYAAQMEKICVYSIQSKVNETDVQANSTANRELARTLETVESLICPGQCSNRGNCSNGKCICDIGFANEDCSMKTDQPPKFKDFVFSTCDFRSSCRYVYVIAENVRNSTQLSCNFQYTTDFDRNSTVLTSVKGTLLPVNLVQCQLPMHDVSYVLKMNVTLTNDGKSQSNGGIFTIYNGDCMACNDSDCGLKETSCLIKERCYKAGESCNQFKNKICDPHQSTSECVDSITTTIMDIPSAAEKTEPALVIIIVPVVVGLFIMIVIVGITLCLVCKRWKSRKQDKAYTGRHDSTNSTANLTHPPHDPLALIDEVDHNLYEAI